MRARQLALETLANSLAATGFFALERIRRRQRRDFAVFILEYHGVGAVAREGTVKAEVFRRHIRWLKRHFRLVTVERAVDALAAGLEEDLAVLTFDDGYGDNFEVAKPILDAENLPATIYLATGFLDGKPLWFDIARRALPHRAALELKASEAQLLARVFGAWPIKAEIDTLMRRLKDAAKSDRLQAVEILARVATGAPAQPLSWDQARQLQAEGWELGAHTRTHPILARLDEKAQEKEIVFSLDRLEAELGRRPTTFAVPNGGQRDYDQATLRILRRLGLKATCTTRRGRNRPGADPHQLFRLGVGNDSVALLAARLAGLFDEDMRRFFGRS